MNYTNTGWIREDARFPLPRGMKPHIMPRYDCPPNSVYSGWNRERNRFEITCPLSHSGHIWGGFKVARELWNPGRKNRWIA